MNRLFYLTALVAIIVGTESCETLGLKKSGNTMPNDGQLHGVAPGKKYKLTRPPGMVYIASGHFEMGPSDEDPFGNYTASHKSTSVNGFWMDETEISNNEYRQFTNWVRDSIVAKLLASQGDSAWVRYVKEKPYVNWKKVPKMWADTLITGGEGISSISISTIDDPEVKEIDVKKLVYSFQDFDYRSAALNMDTSLSRSSFVKTRNVKVYPDTLCWVRDFTYSNNDPMARNYFSHPAYGNYPVVGVNWDQANAFCNWRTHYLNAYLRSKKRTAEADFRLPSEAQWEYAARGGRHDAMYPWGRPYLRNKKGCLLANFKPGRGVYDEDGGVYTVPVDSYWPNDFGLYNMAGNVAEWTSSAFNEGGYSFQHDLNPDIRFSEDESKDNLALQRITVRGGSWKDIGYFLQTGIRAYEFQKEAKSYIGFRCVLDLPAGY